METAVTATGQQNLNHALTEFRNILTPTEIAELKSIDKKPKASDVVELTARIDNAKSKRLLRKHLDSSQCGNFLKSVQGFASVVDTFSSISPETAGLIWGSVKLLVIASLNVVEYFEKVSQMFMRFGVLCPAYQEFQVLYPSSPGLQNALSEFYAVVIRFCKMALEFVRCSALKQAVKAAFKPYKVRFDDIENELCLRKEQIRLQIDLAAEATLRYQRQRDSLFQDKMNRANINIIAKQDYFEDIIKENNQDLVKHSSKTQEWQLSFDKEMRHQRLLDRISTHDYQSPFSTARSLRDEGTGQWFFNSSEFEKWMDNKSSSILYGTGIPGSGKTILTSSLIETVFEKQSVQSKSSICYFFCHFRDQPSLSPQTILRCLNRQILGLHSQNSYTPELEESLQKLFGQQGAFPTCRDLYNLLLQTTKLSATTYLIIDGLDECSENDRHLLLNFVIGLVRSTNVYSEPDNVIKIFIASRYEFDILKRLTDSGDCNYLSIDLKRNTKDIEQYVDTQLRDLREQNRLSASSDQLLDVIKAALVEGAEGMFLWVIFQLKDICNQPTEDGIRKVIQKLPRGLHGTYRRILERISEDRDPDLAVRILRWLAYARRPLTLSEIGEATSVQTSDTHWIKERFTFDDPIVLVKQCGHLVTWDSAQGDNGSMKFAHLTVLEFLQSIPPSDPNLLMFHLNWADGHRYLAQVCLTYLNFGDFESQIARTAPKQPPKTYSAADVPTSNYMWQTVENLPGVSWVAKPFLEYFMTQNNQQDSPFDIQKVLLPPAAPKSPVPELKQKYILLDYIIENWVFHCDELSPSDKCWNLFKKVVDKKSLPSEFLPWARLKDFKNEANISSETKILNWAIYAGHSSFLSMLHPWLNEKALDGFSRRYGGSPIEISTKLGHTSVVDYLLNNTYCIPAEKNAALRQAAAEGYLELVCLLLSAKADVSSDLGASDRRTPLTLAAQSGHLNIVEVLLSRGADDAYNSYKNGQFNVTALQVASAAGHLAIVQLLIKQGPMLNAAREGAAKALQAAARNGHLSICEELLRAGADIDAPPYASGGQTALQGASQAGHLDVVELLIAAGANVNDNSAAKGFTALEAAAFEGHLAILNCLLDAGADVNAKSYKMNALVAAVAGGNAAVIKRLEDAGAKHIELASEPDARTSFDSLDGASLQETDFRRFIKPKRETKGSKFK